MRHLRITPFFILLFLTPFLFTSCEHEYPNSRSTRELISGSNEFGKTYQVSHIEIEIGTVTPHPCVTDNFVTYFPSGRYEVNEGATKCDPNDPPALIGSWSLNRNETLLFIEIDNEEQVWEIDFVGNVSHEITSNFREGLRTYFYSSSN